MIDRDDLVAEPAVLPYVAVPAGERVALDDIARRAAQQWCLPQPELLRLSMNAVYAAGPDVVLRVGRPTAPPEAALALAKALADAGIAVARPAIVEVVSDGGLSVLAFERVHPCGEEIDWHAVGRMVRCLHRLDRGVVPAAYPRPRGLDFPWWQLPALLALTIEEPVGAMLDATAVGAMRACLDRHATTMVAARTVDRVLCHGDLHPGNIIQSSSGPVLLDWDLLCTESAAWDHGPLITWTSRWGGATGVYESFAVGYGADLRHDAFAMAFADLRLLAATLMRVRAAAANPAARPEAERRIAFWRGDPDPPMWSAM